MLEQYEPLNCFFAEEVGTSRLLAPHTILQRLQDPLVQMYLEFLEFVLPIFTNLNRQLQSEAPQIHTLRKTISDALRSILDCYMKSRYLASTPVEDELKNPLHSYELKEVYLGAKVASSLLKETNLPAPLVEGFRQMSRLLHQERTADLLEVCIQGSGYQTSGNARSS